MLTRRGYRGFASCALCGITEFVATAASAQGTPPAHREPVEHAHGRTGPCAHTRPPLCGTNSSSASRAPGAAPGLPVPRLPATPPESAQSSWPPNRARPRS